MKSTSLPWGFGRTILLEDTTAGFLPTADIGAGMAVKSAWVLIPMLRHADTNNLRTSPDAYDTITRLRVEATQGSTGGLAGMLFWQSNFLVRLRDLMMCLVSTETTIKPIQKTNCQSAKLNEIVNNALNT